MIVLDKPTCFNWKLIDRERLPAQFTTAEVKEDFELLFMEVVDPVKLKDMFRNSTREPNQPVRKFLWKRILLAGDKSQTRTCIDKYMEKRHVLFGKELDIEAELPDFVDKQRLVFYYLNEEGKSAVGRLLNVLAAAHPDITFAPLLVPLASLFLHYMEEGECYACLLSVVESQNKLTQTDIHWATTNHVFRRFAQKYAKSAYEYVLEALYKRSRDPEACFEAIDNWMWWIFEHLPFNYVLNIVDSFLLEGQKVLYRYGIAILDSFYKSLQPGRPNVLEASFMSDYCSQMEASFDKLMKTAFGLRNMSRKNIEQLFQVEERAIKKMRAKTSQGQLNMPPGDALRKGKKPGAFAKIQLIEQAELDAEKKFYLSDGELKSDSESSLCKRASWTLSDAFRSLGLTSAKRWHTGQPGLIHNHSFYHHHPQSTLNLPAFSVESIGSAVLTPPQIAQLWRWLPSRYQILDMQIIYSTNIHGCRFMTLFDKIEYYPSSIFVVKTLANAVFGAFCSQPWSERVNETKSRKASYFGNGETFLFELVPTVVKHDWIGKRCHGETLANQELFMFADNVNLKIGGSTTPGKGPGLLINNCLTNGRTAVSDTFENPLLGGHEFFEIAVMEVFSFNSS